MPDTIQIAGVDRVSLRARNFVCFRDAQGFDEMYPINVIVGRNNTGKLTLVDLVETVSGNSGW